MKYNTIPEMFVYTCEKYGESQVAFKYKNKGAWHNVSHKELRERVEKFALGLMELGIHKGDRVGIVSENRIEWVVACFAISMIGAIDVPIFPILTAKQEEHIYSNCQASAIIVSNNFQLNKVLEFKENISSLRHVIVMNDDFACNEVYVRKMSEVSTRGENLKNPVERRTLLSSCCGKINENDVVTIIYTSGTTGIPKGVMLTHKNFVSDIVGALQLIGSLEGENSISYLPFCHAYERTAGFYAFFTAGVEIALAESVDSVSGNIKELKPTILTTVPKFMETIKKRIFFAMEKEPPAKKKLFHWAVAVGSKYARNKLEGKNNPIISAQYAIADKLVFSKLRDRVGGRLKRFLSGGASLPDDINEFFTAMGFVVLQGYGLTESSPIISMNYDADREIGTVGKPLPNVEIKIAEDGEILVRGPIVMKGYYDDPIATDEAIDPDGWLYTGDIGLITAKGNVKITDRKKHIFVSSGGKNIAPQPIENLLTQSRYIDQCVLIGEKREYCTALLSPNYDQLKQLASEFNIEYKSEDELFSNQKIMMHIKREIDYLQKDLSKFERVRKFSLLSKAFTIETGELSPKMSVRRHIVERNYEDLIDKMYGEE